jgi:hypothetical protein
MSEPAGRAGDGEQRLTGVIGHLGQQDERGERQVDVRLCSTTSGGCDHGVDMDPQAMTWPRIPQQREQHRNPRIAVSVEAVAEPGQEPERGRRLVESDIAVRLGGPAQDTEHVA